MATATSVKKRKRDGMQDDHVPLIKKIKEQQPSQQHRTSQTQLVLEKEDRSPQDIALNDRISLQIVTGSYDRGILHGITATIPTRSLNAITTYPSEDEHVNFSDSFLFAAHSSSIRCLDISGSSETGKRTLATGGSDERINLYALSTTAPHSSSPSQTRDRFTSSLVPFQSTVQNPKNRSLGNLLHHDRAITRLHFPPNSNKLFSGSEDNNIAITRSRDWTLLSSIRAPIPKAVGRPSGDTAAPGEVPAGINDFAIHPSHKLMLSVGRGERCLRLWNLMTGKKAGVLNFDRDVLAQVGEGKYSSGEGRRVLWSDDGEAYVVVFERGAVVYGLDSKARAVIKLTPPTKLHQVKILPKRTDSDSELLAASSEDGRILFFDMQASPLNVEDQSNGEKSSLPVCTCIAQLGGHSVAITGRIKDFEILPIVLPTEDSGPVPSFLVITGSSDGAVRIWNLPMQDLNPTNGINGTDAPQDQTPKQIGTFIGGLETGDRITCLGAFVMDEQSGAADDAEVVENGSVNGIEHEEDEEGESENGSWDGIDS